MNGNARFEEYKAKLNLVRSNYKEKFSEFMKRRRNYTKLDEGVQEERDIRQEYQNQIEALSKEYKDILETAQQ
ncbi:MAG: hypothetical protein K5979_03460 [Ruminococcus sp.]|nr:hypothetical protein [Ruminococcus sp.]